MIIYTMGFTQKSAEVFFGKITDNNIECLIDVRLNNQSQLAGFTKGRDLSFFLDKIAHCDYFHDVVFSPTQEILKNYKNEKISWKEYEREFNSLIEERKMSEHFQKKYNKYSKVLLLCSEVTPECCHRRLVAETLSKDLAQSQNKTDFIPKREE